MGLPRGNMDSDLYEALDQARAGEFYVAITAGSIFKFSDKMLQQYMEKIPDYGHGWLKKPLKEKEKVVLQHLQEHWGHTQENSFSSEQLIGLALMAMMVVQLREIQKKSR